MPCSVPVTRQPYGPNQSAGVPATTLEAGRGSMPKSFQSTMKTRLSRPRPQAVFLVSWAEPGVRPPSPSNTKTFTSPAPASFRASAAPAEAEEPLPGQRPPAVVGEGVLGRSGALVPGPDSLVEHREGGVDERHRVAGREHETVAEPSPRPKHVPAHGAGQQQGQHHVHLGS